MPESQVVHKTETPVTVESLQADFEVLGIEKGMTLLVHSSLSAMGWVCGGPVAVIIALQEVLGETGTLVNTHRLLIKEGQRTECLFSGGIRPCQNLRSLARSESKKAFRSTHPVLKHHGFGLVNTHRLPTTCTFRPAPGCWALKQYVHTSRRIPGRLSNQRRRPRGCPDLTGGFKGMEHL